MASKYPGPPESLTLYEKIVAGNDDVALKGAANPYTSRNGHMFSYLDKQGSLALRLPPDLLADFLSRYDTEKPLSHGVVMKEYAAVPDELFHDEPAMRDWFNQSHAWIGTLKPKPTKKPKKSKKPKA